MISNLSPSARRPLGCPPARLQAVTLLLAVLGLALPAAAQETSDASSSGGEGEIYEIYVEIVGGVSLLGGLEFDGAGPASNGLSGSADPDTGWVVGGAVGAKLFDYFRAELQITENFSDIDELQSPGAAPRGRGNIGLLAFMANGYFDGDFGIGIYPYVGAGIGWGLAEFQARNNPGTGQVEFNDTDGVFVWNVMAGVTVPFTESVDVSAGYRYIATENELVFKGRLNGRAMTPSRFEVDGWDAHQVLAGLRINF